MVGDGGKTVHCLLPCWVLTASVESAAVGVEKPSSYSAPILHVGVMAASGDDGIVPPDFTFAYAGVG